MNLRTAGGFDLGAACIVVALTTLGGCVDVQPADPRRARPDGAVDRDGGSEPVLDTGPVRDTGQDPDGSFASADDAGTSVPPPLPVSTHCSGAQLDLWDYLLPSCAGPSVPGSAHARQVWPAASSDGWGHFYITKDPAGAGFEHWSVNGQWFRIHRDTTWAFNAGSEWCDVQCRSDNHPGNCAQRWAGDSADYAFTVYRARDDSEGAPWYPRCVTAGQTFTTYFKSTSAHLVGCAGCTTNFDGDTEHTVHVNRLANWEGFADVLQMDILGGSGTGESYSYARGVGWVGFGRHLLPTHSGGATAAPADPCGRYAPGNICTRR